MNDIPTGTTRLQNLSRAHWQSAALQAALNLDFFTVISGGASEISQIAQKTGLDVRKAQLLADVLSSLGLIETKDGKYQNAPDVERHAVKDKKGYIGTWLIHDEEAFKSWANILPQLKSNDPPKPHGLYGEPWTDLEAARRLNRATYNIGIGSGYRLAHRFDFTPHHMLLDLGGGSGAYSIAICNTYPNMRAIVLDYPTICQAAAEIIAEAGLSDRIGTHPGDLTEVDFPSGGDVMLMSSNLPDFSRSALEIVYNKAFHAMEKGGTMIILGEALYDDRSGPLASALWNFDQLRRGGKGESHTISQVCSLLEEAGFRDFEVSDWVPGILTSFFAHKPK
jgi:hypothetical protein